MSDTVRVFLIVIGINAVVWTLILGGFEFTKRHLTRSISAMCAATGECLVVEPRVGYCNYMKGFWSVKSLGIAALTNKRLIFRGPMGTMNLDIRLDQIASQTRNVWFQGNYRNGNEFLILKLKDGREIAFQVKDMPKWADCIQSSVTSDR